MTTAVLTDRKEEAEGGYVADISSAYLFKDNLYIQFTTQNDPTNKWVYLEFKEYKFPENCECHRDNNCGKGEWKWADQFSIGNIPVKYTTKGIPLRVEKKFYPDQEHQESKFWVIHIPSDGKYHPENYSEASFGGFVSKKTSLKPAAIVLLPLAIAADIVLLPVYIIGGAFLDNIGR
ncbi:MAG: hypothetical protein HC887_06625 [Desulfobacteraceae bacterium]|nr:hypothetical protein [Desulfobacteraceae bacterium]